MTHVDVTSLEILMGTKAVRPISQGLEIEILPTWIVDGEDRASYTTLIRLVECCREFHWRSDISPLQTADPLDCTCVQMCARFKSPVSVYEHVAIVYTVTSVGRRSYDLRFQIMNAEDQLEHATVDQTLVFLDPITHQATQPPEDVRAQLLAALRAD